MARLGEFELIREAMVAVVNEMRANGIRTSSFFIVDVRAHARQSSCDA
jgi:hypothetical protein